VFFSQAEDGIRDRNVTGVQTCALPICRIRILIDRHILTTEPTGPLARARSWRPMSTNRDGSGATGRPGRSGRSPSAQPPTSGPPPSGPPPPRPGTPPDDAPPPF